MKMTTLVHYGAKSKAYGERVLSTDGTGPYGRVCLALEGQEKYLSEVTLFTPSGAVAKMVAAALNGEWEALRSMADEQIEPYLPPYDDALDTKTRADAALRDALEAAGRGHLVTP